MLDDMEKHQVIHTAKLLFPEGPRTNRYPQAGAKELLDMIIYLVNYAHRKAGSPIRVDAEKEPTKYSTGKISGLIIDLPDKGTSVVAVSVKPSIARIGGTPIYLKREGAAGNVAREILRQIDLIMTSEEVTEVRATDRNWDWNQIRF